METAFSIFAWVSVVLFQAVVHYAFARKPKKKLPEKVPAEEEKKVTPDVKSPKQKQFHMPQRVHLSFSVEEEDCNEMDGDEPEVFYELLSQTGSEMARVSRLFRSEECVFAAELLTWNCLCSHNHSDYFIRAGTPMRA